LTTIAAPKSTGQKNEVSLSLPCNLAEDSLLLGWASFLGNHVDEEEVHFFFNRRGVSVHLHDRTVTRDVLLQRDLRYSTSVTTHASSNQDVTFFLALIHGVAGQDQRLVASNLLPKDHLSELALQFRLTLDRILTHVNIGKPNSSNFSPRLSILNLYPQMIPGPQLLHDLAGNPEFHAKTAIDFTARDGSRSSYTYAAMHESADRLAERLANFLHAPSQGNSTLVVPLLIPQVPELYIALLGILKAGAAFCPLNLDAPAERIKFVVKDVKASVFVTTSAFKTQVPSIPGLAICVLDEDANETVTRQHHNRKVTPLDLAYVLYSMLIRAYQIR